MVVKETAGLEFDLFCRESEMFLFCQLVRCRDLVDLLELLVPCLSFPTEAKFLG